MTIPQYWFWRRLCRCIGPERVWPELLESGWRWLDGLGGPWWLRWLSTWSMLERLDSDWPLIIFWHGRSGFWRWFLMKLCRSGARWERYLGSLDGLDCLDGLDGLHLSLHIYSNHLDLLDLYEKRKKERSSEKSALFRGELFFFTSAAFKQRCQKKKTLTKLICVW